MIICTEIKKSNIVDSLRVLVNNGIDPDEAECVLQAIGYTLLEEELFPYDMQ